MQAASFLSLPSVPGLAHGEGPQCHLCARTRGEAWPNRRCSWARGSLHPHPHPTPPGLSSLPCAVAASAPSPQACPRPTSWEKPHRWLLLLAPPPLPSGDTSPPLAAPRSTSASSNMLPLFWIQLSQSHVLTQHPAAHSPSSPHPRHLRNSCSGQESARATGSCWCRCGPGLVLTCL